MGKTSSQITVSEKDLNEATEYLKERKDSNYFYNSLLENANLSDKAIATMFAEYLMFCKDKTDFYTKEK